jgi:hypothetical protein
MDLDIDGVLPVDVGVMVKGGSDLLRNKILGVLQCHWESRVDDDPPQHIECPGIPGLGDARGIHLLHKILHVVKEVSGVGEVVHEVRLDQDTSDDELPLEGLRGTIVVLVGLSPFVLDEADGIMLMAF